MINRQTPRLLYALMLFAIGCSANEPKQDLPSGAGPNIVILFADDMGYGDLASYGHPLIRTPSLDGLANEGVRFTSFYMAAATCTPSRAALLTGRYPIRSGLERVVFPHEDNGMRPAEVTLPELLREQSYSTHLVGKWHLGDRSPYLPTENGFDTYFGLLTSNDMTPPWVTGDMPFISKDPDPLRLYRQKEMIDGEVDFSSLTEQYTQESVSLIKQSKSDRPFFLLLSYAMPHVPLAASQEFQDKSQFGLYGASVEELDASVARVLEAIDDKGVRDNTIVIFTSDNGPWINLDARMTQGGVEAWHGGSAGSLRGSKGSSYEGGFRVPTIISWPDKIKTAVSTDPVTSLDLFATLVKLVDADVPESHLLDGVDALPHMMDTSVSMPLKPFFYYAGKELQGIRSENWKFLATCGSMYGPKNPEDLANPTLELFDLSVDPSERINRIDDKPELADKLKRTMAVFAKDTGASTCLLSESSDKS